MTQNTSETLPPHSLEAEKAVLGSILALSASLQGNFGAVDLCLERLQSPEAFFSLANRDIFQAIAGLRAEGKFADEVLLAQRLRDTGKLDQVGGNPYICDLASAEMGPSMIEHYLGIVAEKFIARKAVQMTAAWRDRIGPAGCLSEAQLEQMQRDLDGLRSGAAKHLASHPQNISCAVDFEAEILKMWESHKGGTEPGWELPFPFKFKIRPYEMTVMTGDSGSGKSSMLGQISLCLAKQGVRSFTASFEVPPWVTYWIMQRQMIGRNKMDFNEPQHVQDFVRSLGFLQKWVKLYNFLGIGDWRQLLDVFRWLRKEEGTEVFIVDSVGRIGIEDDDYTTQGLVAALFANFAITTGAHVFLVIHENKGDGSQKLKVRGSKKWTDDAFNVIGMMRNEKKGEKIADLRAQVQTDELSQEDCDAQIAKMFRQWDAKFILSKQRLPGSQQNASRHLYFDWPSLQFHEQPGQTAINYLL
jgi:riboflavin synthase